METEIRLSQIAVFLNNAVVGVKEKERESYEKMKNLTQSDSVLWQKPFQPQKTKKKAKWQHKNPTKNSNTQRLLTYRKKARTDLRRSVGVTAAIQMV